MSKGITEGYACSFIHQLRVGLNCLDTDSNLISEECSIFLCAIPIWKKINYNKQKGYKNMISDTTCLHFSWMTLLLVKKRSWVIFLSTELLTLIHFKLMQRDGALGESICLPSWKMLRFWWGLQWQQVCWCYLFNHQVKFSLHSHKSEQILWKGLTSLANDWHFSPPQEVI